jgi:hypothetical protein
VHWAVQLVAAVLFSGLSVWAIADRGLAGLLPEHTRNAWSVQIWFDLLIAATVAFLALLPEVRRRGMQAPLWFGLIALTGSIGVLLMVSRLTYLRRQQAT